MAKYDVTVDTRDMANKIDTVSNKVSGVTTAVVAMEAAVIAAERDATNKLCKRLNKGFFSLVTFSDRTEKCHSVKLGKCVCVRIDTATRGVA